jgi:GGDEF domain-containing protein
MRGRQDFDRSDQAEIKTDLEESQTLTSPRKQGRPREMLDIKYVNRSIIVVVAIIGGWAFIVPEDVRKSLVKSFWEQGAFIPWSIIISATLALCYASLYVMYLGYRKAQLLQQRLTAVNNALEAANKIQETDLVTGIPNQRRLELDIERTLREMAVSDEFQLIMIDLDNFGKLNNKYGHHKADEVISYIAITVQRTMRRNEGIYKQRMTDIPVPFLLRRIYRKYQGGDEFVFLLGGDEAAALGFLTRLKGQFDNELTRHVSNHVLFDDCQLQFHAGVCQIDADDTVQLALDRVSDCLRLARQTGSPSRVFWYSKKTAADFEDPKKAEVYARAVKVFKQ